MRALLWLAVVALAAWSGWWWFASDTARRGAENWFVQQQAAGWTASHAGITRAGYPNRIDLTITEPRLITPRGDWGWQAPFVQSFALSYKPWHIIAALPPTQNLLTPIGTLTLQAEKLQASLILVPGSDLALDRFNLAGQGLALDGLLDLGITQLALATRPTLDRALGHDLGITAAGITPPAALGAALPVGLLPAQIDILHINAGLEFDAALDRHAGQRPPQLTRLGLRELRLEWGEIRLFASGSLTPDANGLAEGPLDLRLEGSEQLLELAQALGLLTPETRPGWQSALGSLSPSGRPIELPLRLSGGLIQLGPLVLGPAPRLRG